MNEPQAANPYPLPGEILDGKYRVEKMLGEGGMGAVARATHLLLHRSVAVKFMNPQFLTFPGAVERFLNEGRASGAISSDHVVPVSDVGCLPTGTPYLVMECLYGLDLADLLVRDGPAGLPIRRAVHFVIQILRGLQAAHSLGIIHRDMKPSNCFVVTHDGIDDFVKILDFGISKIAQPGSASLTQTNSALGTPLYMSPEQARSPRDVDARSDLYSVGVILYELLTGHTPFFSESGEFTEILFKLFTADPPPIRNTRPDLPEELAAVVHRALTREVPDRYASALELAEALAPWAGPKSLDLIEKMRIYTPPSLKSITPLDVPTSLAAFSQLQQKNTDVMGSRPRTDVQKGAPATEVLIPNIPAKANATEILKTPEPTPRSAARRLAVGLGQTQLDATPGAPRNSAVSTDLGASHDMAPPPAPQRFPVLIALPITFLALVVGGAIYFVSQSKSGAKTPEVSSAPPPPVSVVLPPTSTPPVASAPASAEPTTAVMASANTSASAPPKPTAPPRVGTPRPNGALETGIHQ